MRYGAKILFKNSQLQLNPGNHYGVVGANGSGKSTLLKILSGELIPEAGDVAIPTQFKIGTLKQDHFLYENVPILDTVLMGKQPLWKALQEKEKLLQQSEFSEEDCHLLDDLEKKIVHHDGYAAESQAAQLLEGLGLLAIIHRQPMSTLSGGYKLRVLLAQVLFSQPDILLLDEPTNHLDLFSIRWLEGYLKKFPGTIALTSHDRDFLNGVCDHIIDVDHEKLKVYKGSYDEFFEVKSFVHEQLEARLVNQEKKREHLQQFIDRFRAKSSKARQAQSKMKLVEKLEDEMAELNIAPSSRQYPTIKFEQYRPSGAIALKVHDICKSYGSKRVLHQVSFEVERGDHIAFLGPNGIGKSTLLEILTDSQKADTGTVEWGYAVQLAYFPQDHAKHVRGHFTVLTWLQQFDHSLPEERFRSILGLVLFSGDDVHKPVEVLSGGETARLLLARMMLVKHNVLIFDEPTNHLDMEASETLLEALKNYPGTLLCVSHNRHFVSHFAKRIIELSHEGLHDFQCSFEEYLEKHDYDLLSAAKQPKESVKSKSKADGASIYELQKEQQKLKNQQLKKIKMAEDKCHRLEKELKIIDEILGKEGFYTEASSTEIERLLAKKNEIEQALEISLKEWEQASSQ